MVNKDHREKIRVDSREIWRTHSDYGKQESLLIFGRLGLRS